MKSSQFKRLKINLVLFTSMALLQGCLGTDKQANALGSKGDSDSGSFVQTCQKVKLFKDTVQPVFQSRCTSCHQSGGSGAGKLQFNSSGNLTDSQTVQNYFTAVTKLLPDDGGDPTQNPIVLYPAGNGHITALPVTEADYSTVITWIQTQRDPAVVCDTTPGSGTTPGSM